MASRTAGELADASLAELTRLLLRRDRDVHAAAVSELAERGDERTIPHLVELVVIDSIANDWGRFGFPEVMREHSPPRYLELPEVAWPGVDDALRAVAEPDFDSEYAWVEWESWYSQQEVEPLPGFDEWKLRLYRSYLPPVGGLLDAEPRNFDLQDVRWGNCDRSFLAALNGPDFVPGEAVDAGAGSDHGRNGDDGEDGPERYLEDDAHVFGFEVGGQAYAVPRWVLFPHELLNAELGGVPVSLTYCTLCNAPILYDRRVGDDDANDGGSHGGETLTFGSTGMLLSGNKVMYDEETESLWSQHRGVPIAGEHAERGTVLSNLSVTQTDWADWKDAQPDTLALDIDTGYDWDYRHYEGELGIFRHYWENEDVVQPGVRRGDDRLPEKAEVYGVTGSDPDRVWVFPVEAVRESGPVWGTVDGRSVVALADETGDVAVYEAPALPVEVVRDGEDVTIEDADGTRWVPGRDALASADGSARMERLVGRHGLWFAFRSQYEEATVVEG
jgi:hypothetical protein